MAHREWERRGPPGWVAQAAMLAILGVIIGLLVGR
jgi:hypothetical protein